MNILSFGPRRKKRFIILLVVFFFIPILMFLPFTIVKVTLFLPLLLWVNIVGIPLAMTGLPYFEIHEFGVVPQGIIGYGLIVLGYFFAALFLSMLGKAENNNIQD